MKNDFIHLVTNIKLSMALVTKFVFRYFHFVFFLFFGISINAQTSVLNKLISEKYFEDNSHYKVDSFIKAYANFPPDSLADCYHDIGRRLFYVKWRKTNNNDNLEGAIRYTSKAADLKFELSPRDTLSIQKSLLNLATFQRYGNHIDDAIKSFERLIQLNVLDRKYFIACRQLAECYSINGDFYIAKNIVEKSISQNINIDVEQLALSHYALSEILSRLGFKTNDGAISKNLNIADSLNIISQSSPRKKKQFKKLIEHLNGNRLIKINNHAEAVIVLKENIAKINVLDSSSLATSYNSLGFSNLKLKDYAEAFRNLNLSISFDGSYSPPLENLGDYYLELKEYQQALTFYQKAIFVNANNNDLIEPSKLPKIVELSNSSNMIFLLNHLVQKAKAWLTIHKDLNEKEQLLSALKTLKLADELIDEIKFLSLEEQSKFYWVEKAAELYMTAVEVCYKLNKPQEAFYFMEKNKSILLLNDLTQEIAKSSAKLPKNVIAKSLKLKRKEVKFESDLQAAIVNKTGKLDKLKDAIYDVKIERSNFSDSIDLIYPEFGRAKRKLDIISYKEFVAEYVNKENMVLQYILDESKGYGLAHYDDRVIFFPIEKVENLVGHINKLYEALSIPTYTKRELEEIETISNAVFNYLFPKEISDNLQNRKLLIVADGLLQKIPFEVLKMKPKNEKYLIESSEIQYAYSLSHLDLNSKYDRNTSKYYLGVAPIEFSDANLNSLPYSEEEVKQIRDITGGDLLMNEDASTDNFLNECNKYKILHFSTHADGGEGKLPWLAFRDDKMYLKELYTANVQSEMVVLSSCNSSIGEIKKGEGLMSLARSFFYAGANSIVASLWTTNDKSNMTLMKSFYKNLKKGEDKPEALRNAKLEYIKTHSGSESSPYYWASNIMIGNSNVIESNAVNFLYVVSFLLILIGIISLIWILKRKSKA